MSVVPVQLTLFLQSKWPEIIIRVLSSIYYCTIFVKDYSVCQNYEYCNQVCLRQIACRHSAILSLSTILLRHIRLQHTAGIATASTAKTTRLTTIGQITK